MSSIPILLLAVLQAGSGGATPSHGTTRGRSATPQVATDDLRALGRRPLGSLQTLRLQDLHAKSADGLGLTVWAEADGTWHLSWRGEAQELVWVRVRAEAPITDLAFKAGNVQIEQPSHNSIEIRSVAGTDAAGGEFRSESALITLDSKWNVERRVDRLHLPQFGDPVSRLPVVLERSLVDSQDKRAPRPAGLQGEASVSDEHSGRSGGSSKQRGGGR